MPLLLTLSLSKTALKLSRWLGRGGGSALPGLIAEKIDPGTARKLAQNLRQGSILVTGTNGKTTTTKMLLDILEAGGKRVVTNRSGSNLSRGILSSLIEHANLNGSIDADLGLFEVDEASLPAVARATDPKVIVVLNLFRDQLDRYGELDSTAKLIGDVLAASKADIFLNADDPLVASLSRYVKNQVRVHFFGVEAANSTKLAHDMASDSNHCPYDGHSLEYSANFFGHIGHYRCPLGDFKRPKPATSIQSYMEGREFEVGGQSITLPLPGLYNAYNALAAIAVGLHAGIGPQKIATAIEQTEAAFGRVEKLELDGREVYLLLIKNPTGFNQVIQTFLLGKPGALMIAINDNFADGRDVSWLWDVAVEELSSTEHTIVASGIRAADMALRLKYAGLDAAIDSNLKAGLAHVLRASKPGETVYILPTYTAMLELREILSDQTEMKEFWS